MNACRKKRLGFAACLAMLLPAPTRAESDPPPARRGVGFAFELYRHCAAESRSNLVLSPLSASTALRIALVGARGETAREIRSALGSEREPTSREPKGREPGSVIVADSLWVQSGIELAPRFREELRRSFGVEPRPAPFRQHPRRAADEINAWVEKATDRAIPQLFPGGRGIDASTRIVIADAVTFRATWRHPFSKGMTKPEPFHGEGPRPVEVPMMHHSGTYPYAEDAEAQYLELPYSDARHAMLLILPREGRPLAGAERRLFEAFAEEPPFRLKSSPVRVALPRFSTRTREDLARPLGELGIRAAFDPEKADFSGMTTESVADRLFVSVVTQEALIEVDEAGTRAAAATGIVMGVTAVAPGSEYRTFRADRPFAFAIIDRRDKVILFAGRLVEPGRG